MPKKSIEINPFDGGLNDFADARDIEENELAAATNVRTDQPGRIKIGKRVQSVAERTIGGSSAISAGTGLFHYNSDFNTSNAEAYTEYQLMLNGTNLFRRTAAETNWTSTFTLGSAYEPSFFSVDGAVRLGDGAHSSDTKFYGVTDVDYFGQATANNLTKVNSYIDPPADGDITKDPADQTLVPPSQNVNHLDWIVQKKTGTTEDWFNFNKNDTNDNDIVLISNQYSSDNDTDLTQSEYNSDTTYVLASDGDIDAVSGEMYKAIKGSGTNASGVDYNRIRIKFVTTKSFEEKSVFISVYMESAVKNHLQTEAMKIRIGNNIAITGTSGNDCFIYFIGSDQINADEWTTLELVQGQHDEIEGSPNASGLDVVMFNINYQDTNSTNTTFYLDNLQVGDSSRGLWNGKFRFFQSWIYDNFQESNTFQLNGQSSSYDIEEKILLFRVHGHTGPIQSNNRISGANLYYVEYDLDDNPLDTDKRLLAEVDLERGIKKVGGETWEPWGADKTGSSGYEAPRSAAHTAYLQIMDPPVLETFSTKAGYNEHDKLKKVKFKTSTVMNRRSYVGNVKVTNSADKDIKYSDRIYKSEPNMPDVYTELGYVDVAINDGEAVTALASFGDMLLQFKERTMYLINCTQEIEYLEDTAKFRGVWGQAAVVETDAGIVWVNEYGLFMFDGKEIVSLIDKKIDPENWNSVIGSKPVIGYVPLDRHVLVVGDSDSSSSGYTYSLRSQGFNRVTNSTGAGNLFTSDMTNIVSSNAGVLSWYQDSGNTVTEYKWDAATGGVYVDIQSRDQDFKDPARRKMVKNVYLTYKVPSFTVLGDLNSNTTVTVSSVPSGMIAGMTVTGTDIPANTTIASVTNSTTFVLSNAATGGGDETLTVTGLLPEVKYRVDGNTTEYSFNAALAGTQTQWDTIALKPATSSEASNVYSFQFLVRGVTDKDFEINDINVVYRDKVLK